MPTFALVAPLALSGGQMSWIYGFLALSVFGWMINTGAGLFDGPAARTTRLAGVAVAALFNAAAAATQFAAARRAMRGTHG